MNILIYTPYLDILGGGEQYLLNFADCLTPKHHVTFVWKKPQVLIQAAQRFRIDTSQFKLLPFLPPRLRLKEYDLLFFVSDGSIPFLPFGKSVLLFMSPFIKVGGSSLLTQLKLKFINHIVCFSRYTKEHIDQEFRVNSHLIYPAVTIPHLSSLKHNLILSVGRFTTTLHHKKQDALIDAFIDIEPDLPGWRLVLAGGTETGSVKLLTRLRRKAQGHRISIRTNVTDKTLLNLYAQAKIYWHAAGFGADLRVNPQKAEHFGISIVEAMGQGTVPLIFNAGGPREIVTAQSGRTWDHLKELKDLTLELAKDEPLRQRFAQAAKRRAKFFSHDKFCKQIYDLIEG